MTTIIDPQTDKILNTYRQYQRFTDKEAAGYLTMAHYLDHLVCILKEITNPPPKVVKKEKAPTN